MRNIFKAVGLVITTACNVLVKLLTATERGANSLDALAEAGELKAKNFKNLIELNDEAEFEERKREIEERRAELLLKHKEVKSEQQKRDEAQAAKDAKKADVSKQAQQAQADLGLEDTDKQ